MSGNNSGWNRPAESQPTVKKGGNPPAKQPEGAARRGAKAPSKVKGIVAGLVTVCALGGLCLWMFSGGDDVAKVKADKERGRIKEVAPAVAPKAAAEPASVKEEKPEGPKVFKSKYSSRTFKSEAEMLDWEEKNVSHPGLKTGKKPMPTVNLVESEIHLIVNAKPGQPYLPTPFPKNFDKMMQEALLHKMEIEEDDTPEMIEGKQRIEEAKKVLRAELKKGKDLRQVLEEERALLRKAASDKEFLEQQLREYATSEGATLEGAKDLEAAANKLMEQNQSGVRVKLRGKDRVRLERQGGQGAVSTEDNNKE